MLSSPRYMIFFTTTGILVKTKGISSCRCQAALCSLWFPAPPDDKVHTTQSQQQQQIKPIQWSSAHQYFHRLCKYDSYLKETNFAVVPFWAESTTFLRQYFSLFCENKWHTTISQTLIFGRHFLEKWTQWACSFKERADSCVLMKNFELSRKHQM